MKLTYHLKAPILVDSAESEIMRALRLQGRVSRDQAALEIIRSSGQMIGDVLASLVNFFNPSHIFIGGGIANFGSHLLVAIRRAVLRRSLPLATSGLDIVFFRMGSDAGVLGAIMLALENLFIVENELHFPI